MPLKLKPSSLPKSLMPRESSLTSLLNTTEPMVPKRNTTTDLKDSLKSTTTLWVTTQSQLVSRKKSTSSLIWVTTNSNQCSATNKEPDQDPMSNFPPLDSQPPLTGEAKVQSLVLRTNNNAVHAGLSQPLDQLKVPTSSRQANWFPCLNNNSLIVPDHMVT